MYISQVPATALYTIFKTLLLILLTQTIYSICAWMNRYDLAKIFEQGNTTVLIGYLTSNKYKKYRGMFMWLFIAISFEIVINLLPTIATKYMPFESVIINDGIPKYFQANFSTPVQSIPISSNNNNMDEYCQKMELCDSDINYYGNIVNISNSMEVKQIDFDFNKNQFINEFVNITIQANISNQYQIPHFNKLFNENIGDYYLNRNDTRSIIMNLVMFTLTDFKYKNGKSGFERYSRYLLPMYYTDSLDILSTSNIANIVYSDGQNKVLMTIKSALYNQISVFEKSEIDPNSFNYVFNNSQYYDILTNNYTTIDDSLNKYFNYHDTLYYTYKLNNSLIMNFLQYSRKYNPGYNTSKTLTKLKAMINVYVIKDKNFKNKETDENIKNIINFNMTYCNETIENTKYHTMFDSFNKPILNNIFMYTMLYESDILYGIQGKKDIVANVSPIFIGIIIGIILTLIIIYMLSKYIKNKLYYNTLLETIGLNNLPKINEKNEILLDNKIEN